MKRFSSTILTLIFLLGVLAASDISAQCSLKLNVWNSAAKERISDATATAARSKRVYRSANQKGSPYFSVLPAGSYYVTVKKAGYQNAGKRVLLNCGNSANKSAGKTVSIYMSRPLMVKARPVGVFKIGGSDSGISEPRVSGGVAGQGDEIPPPPPTPKPRPKFISKGVVNGSAILLPKPAYPPTAAAIGAEGPVSVQVMIDEDGNVIFAAAVSGHPLLKQAAVAAARGAKFRPTSLSGIPVKVSGVIVYNFVLPKKSKAN